MAGHAGGYIIDSNFLFIYLFIFHFHLTYKNTDVSKICTVKKEMERARYSKLIIN